MIRRRIQVVMLIHDNGRVMSWILATAGNGNGSGCTDRADRYDRTNRTGMVPTMG